MADDGDKIYPALPRRRQRAREQGQIARSPELTAAISFFTASLLVSAFSVVIGCRIIAAFQNALSASGSGDLRSAIMRASDPFIGAVVAVTLVLSIASILGATLQEGFVLSAEKLTPDLSRINPVKYLEKIFSIQVVLDIA